MQPKTLMTLAVAGGCGVLAMFGIKQATDNTKPAAEPEVEVLVATVDIPVGVPLDASYVNFKTVKASAVPEGSVQTPEEYEGRSLRIPAVAGEAILAAKLSEVGQQGVNMLIPEGYRVVTIPADNGNTFSSLLRPGDRVDINVVFSVPMPGPNGRAIDVTKSKTLLEYVEVFAIDAVTASSAPKPESTEDSGAPAKASTIQLLLTPANAKLVHLAQQKAKLNLMWRNKLDKEDVAEAVVDQSILDDLNLQTPDTTTANYAERLRQEERHSSEIEQEPTDFEAFLNANEEEDDLATLFAPAPVAVEPVAIEPPQAMWTMDIHAGGVRETVEVERMQPAPAASPAPSFSNEPAMTEPAMPMSPQAGMSPTLPEANADAASPGLMTAIARFLPQGLGGAAGDNPPPTLENSAVQDGETDGRSGWVSEGETTDADDSDAWLESLSENF